MILYAMCLSFMYLVSALTLLKDVAEAITMIDFLYWN